MKYLVFAMVMTAALPAVKNLDDNYVAVRKDVWDRVDASDRKLEFCEPALESAQEDVRKLEKVIIEYGVVIAEYKKQKADLRDQARDMLTLAERQRDYIGQLEESCREDFGEKVADIWERANGPLAFAGGYGLCLASVWALNQPTFRGVQ